MTADSETRVHPTAIVEPGAQLAPGVEVGPYAVIGPEVRLGPGVRVKAHAVVTGWTEIGPETEIFSFASVGEVPQDLKYRGERTRLVIGARNRIREHVTINIGTEGGGGVTRIGDDCLLMAGAHVGHDAVVGDRVVVANHAGIAGHCVIGDDVIIGGMAGIHQFVRIGRGAIIGGLSRVTHDVIPYGLVQSDDGRLEGLNLVGLRRRGMARAEIAALKKAYAELARGDGSLVERARQLRERSDSALVREVCDFILADSVRAFHRPQ